MNSEQVKSLVRQGLLFIAGLVAGTSFVSKFFTPDQVVAIFTSDTVINLIVSGVMAGVASFWALISRTDKNIVAAAVAVPAVKAVVTQPTLEGRELAKAVPAEEVVPAGTAQAQDLAKG